MRGQEPEVDPDPDLDLDPDPDGELESDQHGETYPCQHCERHFSTRQGLERHIHIHAITNQQTQLFKCRYCSKSFGSQVGRRRHERRHESGPKKRPGSLAGTAGLLSPVVQTDGSSPDCTSPTSQYIAIGSHITGGALHNSEVQRKEVGPHADRPFIVDENGESKELHPCKYCSKAFGTHTNMRRHQRRIHERHLLPKGVRRKGMLLQEASAQQQQLPDESPSASPPPVYVPSADTEDEADRDDYAVDISKNISENLSFYIDGKIVSSSSVSSCEVIEVDSRSAALFGLDTVIISPNQIGQALKVEGRTSAAKQVSNISQSTAKRRTSTPPFVPNLKVETESASFTGSSSSSSSSTSSSSNLLRNVPDTTSPCATHHTISSGHAQLSSLSALRLICTKTSSCPLAKMSPRSDEHKLLSDSEEILSAEEDKEEEEESMSEQMDSPSAPPEEPLNRSAPSPPEPAPVDLHVPEDVPVTTACNSLLNGKLNQDSETEKSDSTALQPQPESSPSSPSPPPASCKPSPSPVPRSPHQIRIKEEPQHCTDKLPVMNHAPQDGVDTSPQPAALDKPSDKSSAAEEVDSTYCKTFVCNVCEEPFNSIKELSGHIIDHAADWPFKCEFCVQLFGDAPALLAHRTTLHGVGRIFVCSVCSKEFAFLCNLQQHQKDLHPNKTCSNTTVENGKLRPQNYTDPSRAKEESSPSTPAPEVAEEPAPHNESDVAKEEPDVNGNHAEDEAEDGAEDPNEELYTTIKIMASEGGKPKGPDVRLGLNQHYPSYKPPPFPYHSRSHAGSVASATNFTTHNIPQTFSTAIRCTKCGNSFDNMPELHKHILACASASDKKRYTPKKNPIPLKQIVKSPNGVVSPTAATAGHSPFRRMGQPKRLNFNQDTGKTRMSALSKKRNQLVQRAISQKNKAATTAKKATVKVEEEQASNVCPHCSRAFTYPASLHKHMVVSCPMKPVVKKGKKGLAEVKKEAVSVVDKNRMGKEAAPKRLADAKSPAVPQQLKKEERFSLRNRERVGGPVTRSLQMASAAPPAEVKTEEAPVQEPKRLSIYPFEESVVQETHWGKMKHSSLLESVSQQRPEV
ncbi:hypothetical protein INR49_029746 [Caranx melampygus]|nr:hypothetical protein INR49_029746 [Caranx melampygus]